MDATLQRDVLSLFDHVFTRTNNRLEGLTDDEYGWEPVHGCWTVGSDGLGDDGLGDGDAPITTIGWRICHVSDAVGRSPMNGFLQPGCSPTGREFPSSAEGGLDYFRRSYREWRCILEMVDERAWLQPFGPAAGPFADATALAVALHNADEFVHHTAEIALLRDLYKRGPGS